MTNYSTLVLCSTLLIFGCGQTSQPEPASNPAQVQKLERPAPNQVDAAKDHVQQYIDRLLGGDQTVKQGLLGIDAASLDSIESIQVTSALPTYLPDGKKVENMVRVVLNVRGHDTLKNRTIVKNVDLQVRVKEGKWSILGSDL